MLGRKGLPDDQNEKAFGGLRGGTRVVTRRLKLLS